MNRSISRDGNGIGDSVPVVGLCLATVWPTNGSQIDTKSESAAEGESASHFLSPINSYAYLNAKWVVDWVAVKPEFVTRAAYRRQRTDAYCSNVIDDRPVLLLPTLPALALAVPPLALSHCLASLTSAKLANWHATLAAKMKH